MRSFMERLTVCDIYIYIVTSKYYVNEQINKRWFKNSRKKYVVGIKKRIHTFMSQISLFDVTEK